MSLITQCPACSTTFKVVRDQLKISEGWVRCGQCSEVFDSTANLRDLAAVASSEPVVQTPTLWPTDGPSASPQSFQPYDAALALDAIAEPGPEPSPWVHPATSEPQQAEAEHVHQGFVDPELDSAPVSESIQDIELATVYVPFASVEPSPEVVVAQNFSFIAKSLAPSPWHQPLVRTSLVVLTLLLLLGLGLQVVVHERDRIAASEARTRPALLALCAWWHCQINPLRQIESITVDASSFNKQRGDTYLLSFVVKNIGNVVLAKPAIELTLTDTQDTPLLRRVLLPSELGAKSGVVAPGGEWPGAYVVTLTESVHGSALGAAGLAKSVAGYRVLAFYP